MKISEHGMFQNTAGRIVTGNRRGFTGFPVFVFCFFITALIHFSGCMQEQEAEPEPLTGYSVTHHAAQKNGNGLIPEGNYTELNSRIKRNQFLASLLADFGVEYPVIDSLVRASKEIFDIRKIRSGNRYTAFLEGDTLPVLRVLVYEHDLSEQVVFDLHSPVRVYKASKPVIRKTRVATGIIETSLWNTLQEQGIHPALAFELSEIYAWTVDFFGLQKGDHFRVVYQESFVDTLSMGITQIMGALFHHMGQDIYAIPLVQDNTLGYFDQFGNSLRKAFLKAPLRFSRISSRFSYSRMHPILKYRRPHLGVDYAAPVGTPVLAVGDGVVTSATWQGQAGRIVKIRHNSVYSTAYMHLSGFGPGIRPGVKVRQGDIIGYVGSTGLSTGPHLDFRFYRNGGPVDPLKVEAPPVEPVREENMELFRKKRKFLVHLLQTVELP